MTNPQKKKKKECITQLYEVNRGIQYFGPKSLIVIHTQMADNLGALVACPVLPLHKLAFSGNEIKMGPLIPAFFA